MAMPSFLTASLTTVAIAAAQIILSSKLLQPLVKKLVPKQGEGPSRKQMLGGRYRLVLTAKSEEAEGGLPTVVTAEVKGEGDPGYWVCTTT